MNQNSGQAILVMVRSFPRTIPTDGLLTIYEEALRNVTDDAIQATVKRFVSGEVEGHNKAFAPSVAEFSEEARRVQGQLPRDGYKPIPHKPTPASERVCDEEQARVRFGLKVLAAANATGKVHEMPRSVRPAHLGSMVKFAKEIGVEIPENVLSQVRSTEE